MNKSESSRITERVKEYVDKYFSADGKPSVILGVSGGPDSMSLLYIFSKLKLDVTVVHCNYSLRGSDSDKDQNLVEETASMWGYDTVTAHPELPEEGGGNFQDWARNQRYEMFRNLFDEQEADAIATAHHQDDQLETIIQKILRGAGLTSWQGMKVWNDSLFRPLLDFSKAEILQFASANEVPYRLDNSNEESTYARNFLRNGWFPVLDDLFPGWRENILKVPERAREHEALVENLVKSLKIDDYTIDRTRLISLPGEVQKSLILNILKSADEEISVSRGALENLDALPELQTGKKLSIDDRWGLIRDRDKIVISDKEEPETIEVKITKEELQEGAFVYMGLKLVVSEWAGVIESSRLQVDMDRLEWPLTLRTWKEGDKFNPLGMEGSQNISDHLTNNKISVTKKSSVLVLESFDEKICAVIFPPNFGSRSNGTIANWARCRSDTSSTLIIIYNE